MTDIKAAALPPLPDATLKEIFDGIDFSQMVTADDLFYMIARAAIAADRAQLAQPHVVKIHKFGKKGSKRHQYEMSDGTIQEMDELDALRSAANYANSLKAKDTEITDLRAQLAQQSQGKAVAYAIYGIGVGTPQHFIKEVKLLPKDNTSDDWKHDDDGLGEYWGGNEPLYLAAPASAQPAKLNPDEIRRLWHAHQHDPIAFARAIEDRGAQPAQQVSGAQAEAEKKCGTCWGECGTCELDKLRKAAPQQPAARVAVPDILRIRNEEGRIYQSLANLTDQAAIHFASALAASPATLTAPAQPKAGVSVKDALRRCGANTDYHGKLLFSVAEFDHFVSMLQGTTLAEPAAPTDLVKELCDTINTAVDAKRMLTSAAPAAQQEDPSNIERLRRLAEIERELFNPTEYGPLQAERNAILAPFGAYPSAAQQAAPTGTLGYAIFRDGKQQGLERSREMAERWVNAEIMPVVAAPATAGIVEDADLRLAICDIPLPVYGSNSFQHGFVSCKEAVLDLLTKRATLAAQQAKGGGDA